MKHTTRYREHQLKMFMLSQTSINHIIVVVVVVMDDFCNEEWQNIASSLNI